MSVRRYTKEVKKGDYVIVALVLLAALVIFAGFSRRSTPDTLVVTADGAELARYTLPLTAEYALDTLPYPCTLKIDGYAVSLTDTVCPGHDCEHSGMIDAGGESIVCLPNRLLVTLEGGGSAVDAVTQ